MKAIDASVGGLVWVRRRNGSWWPGRIMGLDELPKSCLVSPRSGTPVKLLGREDASVDWYNLEKSKRVKAFRCGEYDECIEKAKASAANLGKKVVKYARREDAILHALELESACKVSKHQDFYFQNDESAGMESNDWVGESQNIFGLSNEFVAGNLSAIQGSSTQDLSQSGLSFEDPNQIASPKLHSMQRRKRKTPNDSEDDETEKTKRMRGLEDLGMGVASKRNSNVCHTDVSPELAQVDGASLSASNTANNLSSGSPVNSSRDYCSSLKKRRSQVANVYESLKKKNRRRPLTKVLESTAMVAVPVACDQGTSLGGTSVQGLADSKVPALESIESKKTSVSAVLSDNSDSTEVSFDKETSVNASDETCDAGLDAYRSVRENESSSASEFPDNDRSNSLFDVPFVREEKRTGGFSPSVTCSSEKLQSEGLDESGSTSVAAHVNSFCTTKWKLKGKRNSRKLSKKVNQHLDSWRSRDSDDDGSDGYLVGIQHMDEFPTFHGQKVETGTSEMYPSSDKHSLLAKPRLLPEDLWGRSHHWSNESSYGETQIGQRSYLVSSKYRRQKLGGKDVSISAIDGKGGQYLSHQKSLVGKSMTPMRNREPLLTRSMSVSPLTAQSLFPQLHSHVSPYSIFQMADAHIGNVAGGSFLYDVKLDVRASYRGQHVPLVSLMSKWNGQAIVGHPITVEVLDEGYSDHLLSNIDCSPESSNCELYDTPQENFLDQSISVSKKSLLLDGDEGSRSTGAMQASNSNAVHSFVEYPRNPVKHLTNRHSLSPKKSSGTRKGGNLFKKTRRLSSFAVAHEPGKNKRKAVLEKLGGPVIACVPLQVVFSRINEALNGSSCLAHRGPASDHP